MHGRQWSDGLHQAVEAKEGVPVKEETQTLATITLQNFFKLYKKLAGMTGTAMTEAEEFMKIYKLEVVGHPDEPAGQPRRPQRPHLPHVRRTSTTRSSRRSTRCTAAGGRTTRSCWRRCSTGSSRSSRTMPACPRRTARASSKRLDQALARFENAENGDVETIRVHDGDVRPGHGQPGTGRPVLVGTTSVENSEKLSHAARRRRYGIEHEVLNAKNHAREAEIVAKAGQQHEPKRGADKTCWAT